MPLSVAIEAFIKVIGVVLEALRAAAGAERAAVEPIAVGVQAILDILVVDFDAELLGELAGVGPGGDFQLEELEVSFVGGVAEEAVAGFVEQGPFARFVA